MGEVIPFAAPFAWWADQQLQRDREAFDRAAHEQWDGRMRWQKPLLMTAPNVARPKRKFESGSTLIVRRRLSDGPEAA